jgi:hypothetical protein
MTITQTALVREFLELSSKLNDDEWDYIGRLVSSEGYDSAYHAEQFSNEFSRWNNERNTTKV